MIDDMAKKIVFGFKEEHQVMSHQVRSTIESNICDRCRLTIAKAVLH
jgi:hypothetical protein